jgi:site-specific recombinase XerD
MANDNRNYHEQKKIEYTQKLRDVLSTMPSFCKDYFRAIDQTASSKTKLSYAYDIRLFFNYIVENNPVFKDKSITEFKIDMLNNIKVQDIIEYQEHLKLYNSTDNKTVTNTELGVSRKLSALRSFLNYYYKHEYIESNPAMLISMPKIHEKAIIRLDADEVASLLDYIEECSDSLTEHQRKYYNITKYRDLAIVTMLLGTGIRVSELVGLDLDHIDFKNNGITVTRKGGNQMIVYFGDEVCDVLTNYIDNIRNAITPIAGHENALFLSMQRKRISVRAVEDLVKKYSKAIVPYKKITPHKLRSTYGTTLYKETNDIYLVADVLGHKDVNTTRKHYADMDDSNRRKAARVVKLREE